MHFRSFAAGVVLCIAPSLGAQSITNGSLTGPIQNGGVPTGWTLLLGSPDTMDENNNVGGANGGFGATPTPSPNGGTWLGVGRDGTGFIERFGQTVSGFTVGQQYRLSWYTANFGFVSFGYSQPNFFEVLVGGTAVGSGASRAVSTGWVLESVTFTALASSQAIAFQLGSNNKSYMSIDGISLSAVTSGVVPEPSTYVLMVTGLTLLGGLSRRKRRVA